MPPDPTLWRAVRWPALVLAVAVLGLALAAILDATPARQWALTIGAPSLTILLPVGLTWLAVALVLHFVRRRRGAPRR